MKKTIRAPFLALPVLLTLPRVNAAGRRKEDDATAGGFVTAVFPDGRINARPLLDGKNHRHVDVDRDDDGAHCSSLPYDGAGRIPEGARGSWRHFDETDAPGHIEVDDGVPEAVEGEGEGEGLAKPEGSGGEGGEAGARKPEGEGNRAARRAHRRAEGEGKGKGGDKGPPKPETPPAGGESKPEGDTPPPSGEPQA